MFKLGEMFKIKDVATHLGVSIGTIYRLVESGELPSLRIGSSWRIPAEGLEEYLKRNMKAMNVVSK